jgi:transcriptional regulator GlxA family with amidase domain
LSCSPDDQVAGVLVPLICRSQGKISIRQLSKELWVSERTIRRRFRQAVGISPKVYCQLVRFQSGLQLLKQNRKLSLAGMALELGYYDQAHWGHDFLGLAGCTPGEWQQKKRSVLSNYYADHQGRITGQPVAYV